MFSLTGWSPRIHAGFLVSCATQVPSLSIPGFRVRGSHPLWPAFPGSSATLSCRFIDGPTTPCVAVTTTVWATARSLATTCAITFVFFSSGYLDVSVHRVGPALCAVTPSLAPGCPIRTSTGQWVCAPRRGFSQLVTSFFAAESPGILHVPFSPFLLSLYLPVSVS